LVKILLADDNATVRHYLRIILEQRGGWQVCDEAITGGEVLQKVQRTLPDLIVLDFHMPKLNGLEVAQQILQMFPEIPILLVTVHFSEQLAAIARSVGIRGVCAKSEAGSIVNAVEALLRRQTYFPALSPTGS
jgi:DNA-binding NarL/FixJ family response regulator